MCCGRRGRSTVKKQCTICRSILDVPYLGHHDEAIDRRLPIQNNKLILDPHLCRDIITSPVCRECYDVAISPDDPYVRTWQGQTITGPFIPGACM